MCVEPEWAIWASRMVWHRNHRRWVTGSRMSQAKRPSQDVSPWIRNSQAFRSPVPVPLMPIWMRDICRQNPSQCDMRYGHAVEWAGQQQLWTWGILMLPRAFARSILCGISYEVKSAGYKHHWHHQRAGTVQRWNQARMPAMRRWGRSNSLPLTLFESSFCHDSYFKCTVEWQS